MTLGRKRKKEYRLNLIGETNKPSHSGFCDYTKILSSEQKVPKGQTRLKSL